MAAMGAAMMELSMRCSTALTASLVLLLALGTDALAQRAPNATAPGKPVAKSPQKAGATKPNTKPVAKETVPTQPPAPPGQQVVMPDGEKIVLLVRGTLITLNDAIQTGNFTVMRDKSAPGFRDANSAARLGQIFSDLAKSGIDLSVASVVTPQLTATPTLDQAKGLLNIQGYFPTEPQQINFELLYQSVGGRWRLFGLSVQPSKAAPPAPVAAPASPSADGAAAVPASKP
jgi:hypothetical protein